MDKWEYAESIESDSIVSIQSKYGHFIDGKFSTPNSKNYLKSKTVMFNHTKPKFVLIPPYYANAHLCLSKECVFHYKWFYKGKYIEAKNQYSYRWNDPKINIKWPIKKPILSKRDQNSKLI